MAIESFRIATFNTENLLHDGVYFAGRKDAPYKKEEYEEKVRWITSILREGAVDLVGFQEQFSKTGLDAITKPLEMKVFAPDLETNIRKRADGKEEATGPFVALASKRGFVSTESIADFPASVRSLKLEAAPGEVVTLPITKFQRPVIQAEVELRTGVVAKVFVAHLKSKRPQLLGKEEEEQAAANPILNAIGNTRSLIIRAAEAVALRQLVLEAVAGTNTPVILFGDLNDDLASVTTQIIAGEQPFPTAKLEQKKAMWDRLLYSVHDLEEAESYRDVSYTHVYDGRYQVLDHIFVSQEFYGGNPNRVATVKNTRIFNDHLRDTRRGLGTRNGASVRSDHGIPVTELWWPESKQI